jgi:TadE-like protein
LVETSVLIPILFTFLLGAVDFGFLFYQWSAAAKAVEVGARIAAVSDPVAGGLKSLADPAVNGANAGDPIPPFTITCNGKTSSCSSSDGSTVTYDATAMEKIVYGRRGGTPCDPPASGMCCDRTPTSYYFAGMCNFFPMGLTPANVQVVYQQTTDLGYTQSFEGPRPTVTVSLLQTSDAALKFRFFFLRFGEKIIPSFTTTITGEALSAAAQP